MTPATIAAIQRTRIDVDDCIACGCGDVLGVVGMIDTEGLVIGFVICFEHHDGPLMFHCHLPTAECVDDFDPAAAVRVLMEMPSTTMH